MAWVATYSPLRLLKTLARGLRDFGACLSVSLSWHYWILVSPLLTLAESCETSSMKQRSRLYPSFSYKLTTTTKDANNRFAHCLSCKNTKLHSWSPFAGHRHVGSGLGGRRDRDAQVASEDTLTANYSSNYAPVWEDQDIFLLWTGANNQPTGLSLFFFPWALEEVFMPAASTPSDTEQHLLQLHFEVLVLSRAESLKLAEPPMWQHDLLNH